MDCRHHREVHLRGHRRHPYIDHRWCSRTHLNSQGCYWCVQAASLRIATIRRTRITIIADFRATAALRVATKVVLGTSITIVTGKAVWSLETIAVPVADAIGTGVAIIAVNRSGGKTPAILTLVTDGTGFAVIAGFVVRQVETAGLRIATVICARIIVITRQYP